MCQETWAKCVGQPGRASALASFGASTVCVEHQRAAQQVQGKANLVDVVQSVNAAEITLDTVVAVRDKVVAAYQSIMNMPI